MTAILPEPIDLVGSAVKLTPMSAADIPGLYRALARREVFEGGYGGGIAALPTDLVAFRAFVAAYYLDGAAPSLAWTIRNLTGTGEPRIVGATWMGEFDLGNESVHLGATAYSPEEWGTVVNPETKLLTLGLAFGHGFSRVKIQADSVNSRSRSAIERLGAEFEGVLRRDQKRADGSWRDTAVYSVLADEWPTVKAGLEQRIAAIASRATGGEPRREERSTIEGISPHRSIPARERPSLRHTRLT
ncbi:GNAT family N-acetyltransferase [Agromyces sp. Root81]|uniref:GNAT family N-acetyltransferase n=1 Tax=Agromyces sp. Root81 TaxID=1736601 RepID=UPI0009EBA145|nr:GNAT family protein [Agromyces sp. Root81]